MRPFSQATRSFFALPLFIFVFATLFVTSAHAQRLELSGGWAHLTGNFGTDGFTAGAAWWFTPQVTVAGDFESTWDTSSLSNFAFTQVGAIAVKSHMRSALFGPRIFFYPESATKHKLAPFGEALFGVTYLNQEVTQANLPSVSSSDTAFSWGLGGGVDYTLNPHWSARANLDFLRTHLSNQGQSHLRLLVGVAYTFGSRER